MVDSHLDAGRPLGPVEEVLEYDLELQGELLEVDLERLGSLEVGRGIEAEAGELERGVRGDALPFTGRSSPGRGRAEEPADQAR